MDREEKLRQFLHDRKMKQNGDKFKKWLEKNANNFELVSYQGSHIPVKVKCKTCGFVKSNVTPTQFKKAPLCPVCDDINRTNESFLYELNLKFGDEYIALSKYINTDTNVYFFHKDCGRVISMRPSSLLNKNRCTNCYGTHKYTQEELFKVVHSYNKGAFLDPSKESTNDNLNIYYMDCGHYDQTDLHKFRDNPTCPICRRAQSDRKRHLDFSHDVAKWGLVKQLEPLDSLSKTESIKVRCLKCGWEWHTNPGPLKYGHGCPKCNQSRGEHTITLILDKAGIKYYYPYKTKGLRDKKVLHYDFYIPDQSILIEYQGGQHYNPVDYFGGEKQFKKQQEHDRMKSEYAKEHGLKLIAIPYTKETISEIKDFLVNSGLKLKEE